MNENSKENVSFISCSFISPAPSQKCLLEILSNLLFLASIAGVPSSEFYFNTISTIHHYLIYTNTCCTVHFKYPQTLPRILTSFSRQPSLVASILSLLLQGKNNILSDSKLSSGNIQSTFEVPHKVREMMPSLPISFKGRSLCYTAFSKLTRMDHSPELGPKDKCRIKIAVALYLKGIIRILEAGVLRITFSLQPPNPSSTGCSL